MISCLSEYLCGMLCKEGMINKSEAYLYQYGFEISLSNIVNLFIMLMVGLVSNSLYETITFYIIFVSLRIFCGGYHASSRLKCFFLFGIMCIICTVCSRLYFLYRLQVIYLILSVLFLGAAIFKYVPVEHENNRLKEDKKKRYRKYSWIIYRFWIAVIIWFYFNKWGKFVTVCSTAFTIVAVLIIVSGGKINDKEKIT